METFLTRIAKLTASMPDTALTVPVETPRSLTPSQQGPSTENFALTAGSALAGWAMSGLKSKVLGADINGELRPDSAPPTQTRFPRSTDTPEELRGLGSQGDVEPWKDEQFDDDWTSAAPKARSRQKSAPASQGQRAGGMRLPAKSKKSVVEQVV